MFMRPPCSSDVALHRFIQPHMLPAYSLPFSVIYHSNTKVQKPALWKGILFLTGRYTKTCLAYAMLSKKAVRQTYIPPFFNRCLGQIVLNHCLQIWLCRLGKT